MGVTNKSTMKFPSGTRVIQRSIMGKRNPLAMKDGANEMTNWFACNKLQSIH